MGGNGKGQIFCDLGVDSEIGVAGPSDSFYCLFHMGGY